MSLETTLKARPSESTATVLWLLLAAFLFSIVGLMGRVTHLTPGTISFGRSFFSALFIAGIASAARENLRLPRRLWGRAFWAGIGQAGNWGFLFASIQTGNMSVAVIAMFTYPTITALIEPLVFGQKASWAELTGSVLVLAGVFLVTPEASLSNHVTLGVILGILSASFLTLRNLVGRTLMGEMTSLKLNFWMCLVCVPVFLPFRLATGGALSWEEVLQTAALAAFFTVAPQYIFFDSLKKVTAATASLLVSAQPVLTIIMGAAILHEKLEAKTLAGGALIVAAIILGSLTAPSGGSSSPSSRTPSASPPPEG